MKIMAREFQAAVSAAHSVADRGSVPILKAIRMAAMNGECQFAATDTAQTIVVRAACEGDIVACIDAEALAAKAKALRPDTPVDISTDGKIATISQGRAKWKVPVLLDDFPIQVAAPIEGAAATVDATFMAALGFARGAVQPTAATNYSGVWVDDAHVVAVDGRQMRFIETGIVTDTCILPISAVDRLVSMFKQGGALTVSAGAAQMSSDAMTLKTRLYDGKPADWRAGLAKFEGMSAKSCEVERDALLDACRRAAAIAASGESAGSFINMQLRFRSGHIEAFACNKSGEEGSDIAECGATEEANVGVNGGLMIANLETLSGLLKVRYGSERDPILMEPVNAARLDMRVVFPRVFP